MKNNWEKEFKEFNKRWEEKGNLSMDELKSFIKSQKELSYKQGVKEEREKWEKKTITIPKGKTHPVHDKCEECIQIGKEQGVKEGIETGTIRMAKRILGFNKLKKELTDDK